MPGENAEERLAGFERAPLFPGTGLILATVDVYPLPSTMAFQLSVHSGPCVANRLPVEDIQPEIGFLNDA